MRDKGTIGNLVSSSPHPVKNLALTGVPGLKLLKDIGVARVSMGRGLLGIAIRSMKEGAARFKSLEGLEEVTDNPVNMNFLRNPAVVPRKAQGCLPWFFENL